MKLLTTTQVTIRIAVIIASLELLIMLLFKFIPHESGSYMEAVLDPVLLALLCTPAIYMWVIKPFVEARDAALFKFNQLAITDPLTQLANRRRISVSLQELAASCIRHKDHGAVLLIDLDGFKLVNDKHGHAAGDAVLVEVSERLRTIVRTEDVIGRLGGDEFVVLLNRLGVTESIARDKAMQVADKLIRLIRVPVDFQGVTLQVGASIGIRILGDQVLDANTAINEADAAMYRAKKTGNKCAVF